MLHKNKGKIILTSLIILLPVIAGLILWNQLPDKVPTHWNAAGEIDGWSSKGFAVFAIPFLMMAFHLLCVFVTGLDPKNKNASNKMISLIFWIFPVISVLTSALTYSAAMGINTNINSVLPVLTGLLFTIIGTYLPQCQHNYTIGIKLPWTLHDENNWNATHHFAGPVWIAGGILLVISAFITSPAVNTAIVIVIILAMVLIPAVYSFIYYRKNS